MKYPYSFNPAEYNIHMMVYHAIPDNCKVLDLGCSTGYIGRKLTDKNCEMWGIDHDPENVIQAKKIYKKVLTADLDDFDGFDLPRGYFDYILLLDVIEHLKNSSELIRSVKYLLNKNGKIIISTPNIANISVRLSLLSGNFIYTDSGILDKTHLKFFTQKTLIDFVRQCGLAIEKFDHNADLGITPGIGRMLRKLPRKMQYDITELRPALLATQFLVITQPNRI
jgi:2-polyprenyl-3-methyl-5-hydroxy-6-metoxy-1,4-benzoquinol methylase